MTGTTKINTSPGDRWRQASEPTISTFGLIGSTKAMRRAWQKGLQLHR
ncbi:hypothetical protein ACGFNU_33270 [Spirillospora sp. NPDC048911]